jgi:hypothetical protein
MEHLSAERLVEYAAGLLEEPGSEELEAHLFSCRACALEAEKLFALGAAVRAAVPPVLSVELYRRLSEEGRVAAVNPMSPGETSEVRYPPRESLLVHRLGGSDLTRVRRVDVALFDAEGSFLVRFDDVPFDAERGEILVACQRHFADVYPPDIDFRVEMLTAERERCETRYTVLHRP